MTSVNKQMDKYTRQRLHPRPGGPLYLHLVDLLLAIKKVETSDSLTILDFGAGTSPYRSLFPNSKYLTADISDTVLSNPDSGDYLLTKLGTVPEEAETFDLVLSTQVLEHVDNTGTYLSECFRLVKPGGRLVLTTHGSFEDHGCPYDFKRWTADGLKREIEQAGFEIMTVDKLTTGPRALVFLMERFADTMYLSRRNLLAWSYWICGRVLQRCRRWIHVKLDQYYAEYQIVSSNTPKGDISTDIYIGLCCCARKPGR